MANAVVCSRLGEKERGASSASFAAADNQVTWTSVNTAGNNISYDAPGDVTYDGLNSYLYDAEGRLCAVRQTVNGTTTLTGDVYEAAGTRVARGSLQHFTCDFNQLDTYNAATNTGYNGFQPTTTWVLGFGGEQVTEYAVTGAEPTLTGAWTHTNVFGPGGLLATYRDTNTYFDLTDWLGSKRVEFSAGASPCAATFGSLPFGNGLTPSGTLGSYPLCADATEHHFTGKERDAESGNDYFGARYYGSGMGRWLSPDWSVKILPIPYAGLGDPQSLNLYSYMRNSPLDGVDADGHCGPGDEAACAIGFAMGVIDGVLRDGGVKLYLRNVGIGAVKGVGLAGYSTFPIVASAGNPGALAMSVIDTPTAITPSNETQAQPAIVTSALVTVPATLPAAPEVEAAEVAVEIPEVSLLEQANAARDALSGELGSKVATVTAGYNKRMSHP